MKSTYLGASSYYKLVNKTYRYVCGILSKQTPALELSKKKAITFDILTQLFGFILVQRRQYVRRVHADVRPLEGLGTFLKYGEKKMVYVNRYESP